MRSSSLALLLSCVGFCGGSLDPREAEDCSFAPWGDDHGPKLFLRYRPDAAGSMAHSAVYGMAYSYIKGWAFGGLVGEALGDDEQQLWGGPGRHGTQVSKYFELMFGSVVPYTETSALHAEYDEAGGVRVCSSISDLLREEGARGRVALVYEVDMLDLKDILIVTRREGLSEVLDESLDSFFPPGLLQLLRTSFRCGLATQKREGLTFYRRGRVAVAVHVRRGDVMQGKTAGMLRYTPNLEVQAVMDAVGRAVQSFGLEADFHVFSTRSDLFFQEWILERAEETVCGGRGQCVNWGAEQQAQLDAVARKHANRALERLEGELHGNVTYHVHDEHSDPHHQHDTLETAAHMAAADVLITAKSSFSYVAAIMNPNCVVFEPFWHLPLGHWVLNEQDFAEVERGLRQCIIGKLEGRE